MTYERGLSCGWEDSVTTIPSERLADVFVEIADTLIDDFDLVEFLQMLTARTSELAGMSATGLLLADQRGALQFMAASDERVHLLELFQIQADEGPCRDCFRQGSPVMHADLAVPSPRWLRFAPRAVAAGFRSVHAFPLKLRQQVIGSVGIFGSVPQQMDAADARIVQGLADVATIAILQERSIRRGEALTSQLQQALDSRIIIEQAKGAIAQLYGVTIDEAFELLRSYSRNHHQHLGHMAALIVQDSRNAPDLRST
jgi:GAF domain-containing protein